MKRSDGNGQDEERLVYTVPEAGALVGLGKQAAYEAAKNGSLPTVKFGRRIVVPKVALQRMLAEAKPAV